jgi:hypothetical protein
MKIKKHISHKVVVSVIEKAGRIAKIDIETFKDKAFDPKTKGKKLRAA